jgi:DNA invertase Pin-like site-specific DNA recombinase
MTAYGYIRKSVVHDPSRMLSPEMQDAEIRKLAAYNGHDDIVILSDLDVSGTKDRTRRPGWDQVLTAIEAGECKDLYSYSMSRLARSVDQLSAVRKMCTTHGVGLHLVREKVDTSSASGRLYWNLQSSFEEFWADVTSERVKDAFAVKRAKDPTWAGPGQPPYGARDGENPSLVVAAFREAGSFDGAARLLNARGVPSRFANGHYWSGSVVRGVVKAHAPDEVGPIVRRGSPAGRRSFRFAGLIECSTCGKPLTGSRDARYGFIRYACSRARVLPHARGWIVESKFLPVIKAEAERAGVAIRRLQVGTAEDEAAMATLAAKRARILENYDDGLYDKATRDARLAAVADEESKLSSRRWIKRVTLPPDLERSDPARVNAYLRRLFSRVVVDMSQKALRGPSKWIPTMTFEWRDPTLRSENRDEDDEE